MIIRLIQRREILIAYLKMKMEEEDFHGVADAAMDLREIDAQIAVFKSHGLIKKKR